MLFVHPVLQIPESELRFSYARSSGAGGQNVNKVNSKAVLRFAVRDNPALTPGMRRRFLEAFGNRVTEDGDVIISADTHRDQGRNVEDCRERLAAMLRSVLFPPPKRHATKPTKGSVRRRLAAKSKQGEKKRQRGRSNFGDDGG